MIQFSSDRQLKFRKYWLIYAVFATMLAADVFAQSSYSRDDIKPIDAS